MIDKDLTMKATFQRCIP